MPADMSYVYRCTFSGGQEEIAYALTKLGVQEIRKIAEKNGHHIIWRKLRLCQVPSSELHIVKALAH